MDPISILSEWSSYHRLGANCPVDGRGVYLYALSSGAGKELRWHQKTSSWDYGARSRPLWCSLHQPLVRRNAYQLDDDQDACRPAERLRTSGGKRALDLLPKKEVYYAGDDETQKYHGIKTMRKVPDVVVIVDQRRDI